MKKALIIISIFAITTSLFLLKPTKQEIALQQAKSTPHTYLEVPFICQAPLETEANWVFHEESCEEAALLQAYNYLTNTVTTKEQSHEIILDMVAWQEKHFNAPEHDLYAEEMKQFITGYYKLPDEAVTIIQNPTIPDIEKTISKGLPVIAGITGSVLQNPYYHDPGYHMLVIIGYTETQFITNDNGTRHGKDFPYDKTHLLEAITDAGGVMLVIEVPTYKEQNRQSIH